MAHEREGARITMPYFLAAPWIVLETDASGDPALMWLIAMLRSASAQEACAGGARRPEG